MVEKRVDKSLENAKLWTISLEKVANVYPTATEAINIKAKIARNSRAPMSEK
jgi:hypothetical protein